MAGGVASAILSHDFRFRAYGLPDLALASGFTGFKPPEPDVKFLERDDETRNFG